MTLEPPTPLVELLAKAALGEINKNNIRRYNLSAILRGMSKMLHVSIASFHERRVPVSEYRDLHTTLKLSPEFADAFIDEYPGLSEMFETTMPNILRLMQEADYFLLSEQDPATIEYRDEFENTIRLACFEMARAEGTLNAYARVIENSY